MGAPAPMRMLSRSAAILSRSWNAQSRRHLATSASPGGLPSAPGTEPCTAFEKDFSLLVGSPASIDHCVFDLQGDNERAEGRLLGLLVHKCPPTGAGAGAALLGAGWRKCWDPSQSPFDTPQTHWAAHAPSHAQALACCTCVHSKLSQPLTEPGLEARPLCPGLRGPGRAAPRGAPPKPHLPLPGCVSCREPSASLDSACGKS